MDADICFCPTSETALEGYVVSLLPHGLVEVHLMDNRLTREVRHRRSLHTNEATFFEGLVELSNSGGITYTPVSDLSSIFPLRVGDEHTYSMRVSWSGREQRTETTLIKVQSKQKTKIGQCRYEVFTLAVTLDPSWRFRFYYYYCPALRRIVNSTSGSHSGNKGSLYPLSELGPLLTQLQAV